MPFLHFAAAPGYLEAQFLDCDQQHWTPAMEKENPGFCSLAAYVKLEVR